MNAVFAAGQLLERCVKQPCELCTTFTDLTKVYERTIEDRAEILLQKSASSSTKWLLWRRQSIFQACQRQNRFAQSTVEMDRPRLPHLRYSISKRLFYGKLSQDKRQVGRWKRPYQDNLNVSYKDFSVNTETYWGSLLQTDSSRTPESNLPPIHSRHDPDPESCLTASWHTWR